MTNSHMSRYERFEQIVAIVPSLVIAVAIAMALVQLLIRIGPLLISGAMIRWTMKCFECALAWS